MKAEVRRLHSPDVMDLREYRPEHPDDFSLLVQVLAGPVGMEGEESFDLEVITPKRLAARVAEKGPIRGRHLVIVNSYEYDSLADWIRAAVTSCEGTDWSAIAEKLSRLGRWEFEDYSE